jgi:hypothetical protein
MKKLLFSFIAFAILATGTKLYGQCDLALNNLQIQIIGTPVVLGPNKCEVTFNAQFDIAVNGGFKVLYFHSWLATDYPATPIFDCGNSNAQNPGTIAELGSTVDQISKSFMDIGFVNVPTTGALNVVQPLTFSTSFIHSPTVALTQPTNSPGLVASKYFNGTADHYTVNNIKVVINSSCANTISVKTDIWGSNSNAPDPKAQCYICALPQFFNDPTINGLKNCNSPRQYFVNISTADATVKNVTYKVYLDVNGNGSLETGTDILAFTSPTIQISAPGGVGPDSYSSGFISLPTPYHNTQPYSDYNYLVLVEGASLSNSVLKSFADPGCIPLPVNFKSFTAIRNRSNVLLKWETSSEYNSSGFAIERNTGNNAWQEISFVPTQATGGNSSSSLVYQYTDLNTLKGVSQYRIRQVDMDNKSKLSEIRSVRGDGQPGKTLLYPNPSSDGRVNIVFEEKNVTRDIAITDMNGRVVRQLKAITSNNVSIENLVSGIYSIRILAIETGEQVVEKIVINNK